MSSLEEINRQIEEVAEEIGKVAKKIDEVETKIKDLENDSGNNYKLDLLNQKVYLIFF